MQVWLHKFVGAVSSGDQQGILHEMAVGIFIANVVFICGVILLAVFGDAFLLLIGSKVTFVSNMNLFLMFMAFLVELNILLLVNYLVVANNYKFVKVYVAISMFAAGLVFILTTLDGSSISTLLMVPLGFQALICLPLIVRIACDELEITPRALFIKLGQSGLRL